MPVISHTECGRSPRHGSALADCSESMYDPALCEVQEMMAEYSVIEQRAATVPAPAGVVFDVKRFALHDGPGIRTTVFFKGCPLSCFWCHNPESQRGGAELLVDETRCLECGACASVCSDSAARWLGDRIATERDRCIACGACVPFCPVGARAIAGETWTLPKLLEVVESDLLFYDESGGGVTLSGGEPLDQPGLCLALLRACRDRGIPTAIDTCGYADADVVRETARFAELFLYDLKVMDDARHQEATGVSNGPILENALLLDELGCRLWIRVPLIPAMNDDEQNLIQTARFVARLRHVERVQVLPYHPGGEAKRARLGRGAAGAIRCPDDAAVEQAMAVIQSRVRVPVTQGG